MNIFHLVQQDNKSISTLIDHLLASYTSPCDKDFVQRARVYAAQLPLPIITQLNNFRCTENHNGTLLLRGFEINDSALGPTPEIVGKEIDEHSAAREGFLLMLLAAFLGDPMGWINQRQGALLNNVLPLRDHEAEQLSTGSAADLDWHSEEAFHPFRADYLTLMCLRNLDSIPTTVGSIQDVVLPDDIKRVLFEPRFIFYADKNFQKSDALPIVSNQVLFGDYYSPYLRIDPSFMEAVKDDKEAEMALRYIINQFNNTLYNVVMQPGDILFMDNYRVVHGRKGFKPRFDGQDRWLKRINITLDLRKSRSKRTSHCSYVIND